MKLIEVDNQVLEFLDRFRDLSPNEVLRLVLGFERRQACEHSDEQFREPILQVLREAGGRIKLDDLYRRIEASGMLCAGDYRGAESCWKNRIRYMAETLRREGIMRRDSDRGVWELA